MCGNAWGPQLYYLTWPSSMLWISWSEDSLLPASQGAVKGDSISIAFKILGHKLGSAIGTWT